MQIYTETTPQDSAQHIDFISKIRAISIAKSYFIRTYGCQLNENDSEKIAGLLDEMGFSETDKMEKADVIVFNTCTIRENANDKMYGNLGIVNNLKKNDPTKIVIVCGCMMKEKHNAEKIKQRYHFVDIIFGPADLQNLPELLYRKLHKEKRIMNVGDKDGIAEGLPTKHKNKFRALCTIIYGCNNFCTYCIVPYVRGRERSREMNHILEELTVLGDHGYKEVMFLGQNVDSYGKDLTTGDFSDLLRKASEITSIKRLRFMTSHPKDISRKVIDVMSEKRNIMPHLHLPLQSGSDAVLKRMNRHYDTAQYAEIVRYAREKIPNISISTDIIVGFPGETEEDFQATLDFMAKIRFDSAFTFQYSKREGTPASQFADQVPKAVVTQRFEKLIELQNLCSYESNQKVLNTIQEVLIEGVSEQNPNFLTGRTPENRLVNFSYNPDLLPEYLVEDGCDFEGYFADVKITNAQTFSLEGELVKLHTMK